MVSTEETRDRLFKVFNLCKRIVHVGYIPLILYLGYKASVPRPSLFKMISPLAA